MFSFKRNGSMVYGLSFPGPQGPASSRSWVFKGTLGSSKVLGPYFPVCQMNLKEIKGKLRKVFEEDSDADVFIIDIS